MGQLLLILAVALVVGVIVFGVAVLITGSDPGLEPAEPDGQALPLPTHRPLGEADLSRVRFDLALRGYRMSQVDQALRRAAYDIGYKDELISVLEAEVSALRTGRTEDAEAMRRAREAALAGTSDEVALSASADARGAGVGGTAAGVVDLGMVTGGPEAVPVVVPRSGPVADLVPGTPPAAEAEAVEAEAVEAEAVETEAPETEAPETEAVETEAVEADAAADVADSDEPADDGQPVDVPAAEHDADAVGDRVPGSRR